MDSTLEKRQTFVEDGNGTFLANDGRSDDRRGEFWYSPKAEIIKWAIIGGIMLFFLIYLVGGYLHAKRRIKKGLEPMRYHKFLVPRDQRSKFQPQNDFSFYRQDDQGYRMDSYRPPPPVYNPDHPTPPNYVPSQGSTKVNPSQEWIAPPPGAPPSAAPVDEEAGVKPGPKPSRFAKLKPSLPSMPSRISPFSK